MQNLTLTNNKNKKKYMKIVEFAINLKDNFSQTLKKAVEKSQAVEKEKKRKQIKFAKIIILIFLFLSICINLSSIFFSYRQDSNFFLILNSVILGINIAFFFLHLIKKKYLNLIFLKR